MSRYDGALEQDDAIEPDADVRGRTLQLRKEPGGWRHYLNGEPVHCGTGVEVLLRDGTWLPGAYECSGLAEDEPRCPTLSFDVHCSGLHIDTTGNSTADGTAQATMLIYRDARLRWPSRERGRPREVGQHLPERRR